MRQIAIYACALALAACGGKKQDDGKAGDQAAVTDTGSGQGSAEAPPKRTTITGQSCRR